MKITNENKTLEIATRQQKNKRIPYKKRITAILSLVLLIQVTNDQVQSRIQENQNIREEQFIKSYIQGQRPSIPEEELNRLTQSILENSERLDLGISKEAIYIEKTYFIMAMIQTESEFKKTAKSKKNARGYMQLMAPTAKWMRQIHGEKFDPKTILEPEVNVEIGVTYMNYLISEMGDLEKATLAYNAGPGAVKKWGGVPEYWTTVNKHYDNIQSQRKLIKKESIRTYMVFLK
ncbi:lytic transglycosylase domain-containing protein [Leptospira sp. GIMC2001]|uniref:lytic transglycosylase domain-containing protein n=1 Tax=Leptospira sp. GIMC2001 TaxID=1513297 RepID=UPI00234A86E5|nr:lytic transglycosylase domain-containing protein [Leptospira sp. GIMC2001]WCL49382.1 lytic transglycosylase domain-containing protein [Leptospira sp. GIMC2001]